MCLAVPGRVVSIEENVATVDMMGNTRTADTSLLDDVSVDDYLLIHAGFAIQKLDKKDALETLEIFSSIEKMFDEERP